MLKKTKSKKAQFFNIMLVIVAAGALSTAFFFIGSKNKDFDKPVGMQSIETASISQEFEKFTYSMEYSAKLASWQSAWELAENAGLRNPFETYEGYYLWEQTSPAVFGPDEYESLFIEKTKSNLVNYLNQLGKTRQAMQAKLNFGFDDPYFLEYDIITDSTRLMGFSHSRIYAADYVRKSEDNYGSLRTIYGYPSFNIDISYDVSEYQELVSKAYALLGECSGSNNTMSCVGSKMPAEWILGDCNGVIADAESKIFRFCVPSRYSISHYKNNAFKIEQIKYKFAIDFAKKLHSIT